MPNDIKRLKCSNNETESIINSWINENQSLFFNSSKPSQKDSNQPAQSLQTTEILRKWLDEHQSTFLRADIPNCTTPDYSTVTTAPPALNHYKNEFSGAQEIASNRMGYWGPLLRYGTYGVFQRHSNQRNGVDKRVIQESPLSPPLKIHVPRQAMLRTLQAVAKSYIKSDADHAKHMQQITEKSGTCPTYIFTRLKEIPTRDYFTDFHRSQSMLQEYYACELYISDILVAQSFAKWKNRAKQCCAREALRLLTCCDSLDIIGAIRYWDDTDFLCAVACNVAKVALLPPFITDPTEPLFKKDSSINEANCLENHHIASPKSSVDFWLFAPALREKKLIKTLDPMKLLYDSCEFSQMEISFEMGTNWTTISDSVSKATCQSLTETSFYCCVLLDNTEMMRANGLASLEQAVRVAALLLVDKLITTQPIVVLKDEYIKQYEALMNGSNSDNEFLVKSLAWNKASLTKPISLDELIMKLEEQNLFDSNPESIDRQNLTQILVKYSQSCMLESISVTSKASSYPDKSNDDKESELQAIKSIAKETGLLAYLAKQSDNKIVSCIVCKQLPHIQLKSELYFVAQSDSEVPDCIYRLLQTGNLPDSYIQQMLQYHGTLNDDASKNTSEEFDNFDSFFVSTNQNNAFNNQITNQINEDNADDRDEYILTNDLPQHFIPGIDF